MVTSGRPTPDADVLVIGGGPAGLAAALAARRNGLSVILADRAAPPIDKACGEGLMPDGVAALRQLGIELGAAGEVPFRGIRFIDGDLVAEARFHGSYGCGMRRTELHRRLSESAQAAGVSLQWRTAVEGIDRDRVRLGGRTINCRWIIGADGARSRLRQLANLPPAWTGVRRVGLRQHFRVRPWSDCVEVHWRPGVQAYVTPVAVDEVCVALLGTPPVARLADLPSLFPVLAGRLAGAKPLDGVRGALSMSMRLRRVSRGAIALVGDASGTVDAITGEGVSLAFRQAAALGAALAAGDLSRYEAAHRRMSRLPLRMARLLLLMDRSDGLRRQVLHALAERPRCFERLLAVHVGERRPAAIALDFGSLAWRLLSSRGAALEIAGRQRP